MHVSYVVPEVIYASNLRMSNKGELRVILIVQLEAGCWTLVPNGLTYTLDFLPFSLYQEIPVILLLAKIINGNIDIDWTKYMSRLHYGDTRNSTRYFAARSMRLKNCESDFWFRACQLANVFDYFSQREPEIQTFPSLQSLFPANLPQNQPLHLAIFM